MKIRFAKKSDKEAILQLITELVNNGNDKLNKPRVTVNEIGKDVFDKLIKTPSVKIFVAEEKSVVVAVGTLHILHVLRKPNPRGELEELIITKKWRGKGVGRKLLQTILKYCKNNNLHSLKLTSSNENKTAHRFYQKNGAKITEKVFRFDLS